MEKGTNLDMGARPLRRAVEKYIEDPLSEAILRGEVPAKSIIEALPDQKREALVFHRTGDYDPGIVAAGAGGSRTEFDGGGVRRRQHGRRARRRGDARWGIAARFRVSGFRVSKMRIARSAFFVLRRRVHEASALSSFHAAAGVRLCGSVDWAVAGAAGLATSFCHRTPFNQRYA